MAKQSGIHQIKGKIGEYSYYKSTGVQGGLIRSINQGLSERVKKSAEYANARLNNQEFGAAANVAGLLGKMVVPKFRPMILPFSQSRMAKEILKVAREHTVNWGQRVVTSEDTAKLAAILTAQSKRNFDEFVSISILRSSLTTAEITASYSAEQATLMDSLGINGIRVVASHFDVATGEWLPIPMVMSTGYLNRGSSADALTEPIEPGQSATNTEDLAVNQFIPESGHSAHQFVVCVVLPERTINGVSHILQEYCSFVAFELPEVSGD